MTEKHGGKVVTRRRTGQERRHHLPTAGDRLSPRAFLLLPFPFRERASEGRSRPRDVTTNETATCRDVAAAARPTGALHERATRLRLGEEETPAVREARKRIQTKTESASRKMAPAFLLFVSFRGGGGALRALAARGREGARARACVWSAPNSCSKRARVATRANDS